MKTLFCILVILSLLMSSCNSKYYALNDFKKVEKIDAHYHVYSAKNHSIEQAQKDNFKILGINTYTGNCQSITHVQKESEILFRDSPDSFAYTTTFCMEGWEEPDWAENTILWLDSCIAKGAIAVKVWKNIGMEIRNKDSVLIMIDDPKFDPVFALLAKKGIPLVGHLGEPKNCWLPLKKMTTRNDSNYFADNPQYHMYLHPEFPPYEEQIAARDRMLEKNPNLIFIGCHLASIEWSVDELALFLDRFPKASVDMAARMGQLYYQTQEKRDKVRNFFVQYQDRILYGTDIIDRGKDKISFQNRMHKTWLKDWEYLVTNNTMTSDLIYGEFQGLQLPKEVIDKIYRKNAEKWYNIWQ